MVQTPKDLFKSSGFAFMDFQTESGHRLFPHRGLTGQLRAGAGGGPAPVDIRLRRVAEELAMITVSICEDEAYFMAELSKLMDKYCSSKEIHASISIFSDGEELLASSQISDIILMDIKLPGSNGMEIVRRLRELGSNSQVIFITAFQKYVFQAFDLDAVHYILKPVSEEKLFSALDKAINRIASNNGKTLLITNGTAAS